MSFTLSKTGRKYKKFYRETIEVAPSHWFVKNYFLYVELAWERFKFHVGDKKIDTTNNLKIIIDIPMIKEKKNG